MSFKTYLSGSLLMVLTAGLADFACTVGDDPVSSAAGAGGASTTGGGTRTTSSSTTTAGTTSTTGTGGYGGSGDSTSSTGGTDGSGGTTAGAGGSTGSGGSGGTGGVKTDGGGIAGSGGSAIGGSSGSGGTGGSTGSGCATTPGLVWKTGAKTNFESYPAPGSEECIKYNGCMWAGQFSACSGTKSESWVMSHNIVSFFPNFTTYKLHDLCLKSSTGKTIVVTVYDTCGDSDCSGCCTANRGTADALIDLEKYTNNRWGVADGRIQWADLGPTKGTGCN